MGSTSPHSWFLALGLKVRNELESRLIRWKLTVIIWTRFVSIAIWYRKKKPWHRKSKSDKIRGLTGGVQGGVFLGAPDLLPFQGAPNHTDQKIFRFDLTYSRSQRKIHINLTEQCVKWCWWINLVRISIDTKVILNNFAVCAFLIFLWD